MKELSVFLVVIISFLLFDPKPKNVDIHSIEMDPITFEYKENAEVKMIQKRIDSLHNEVLNCIR